jgi:photosystem II stability/assembly factor-like uncharacterized protein
MIRINIILLFVFLINCCTGQNWENISPGGGGWFMRVGAGPTGIIIVCSDLSGAYRSLNRGKTWDCIGSYRGLPTHCLGVGFDPVNPSIIFIGSDAGLFRSKDNGETFNKVISGGVWSEIDVSLSNPNICYAARHPSWNGNNGVIYKSTDNGLNWKQISTGLSTGMRIGKIMIHPKDPEIIFFVSGKSRFSNGTESLFKSIDGGITWNQIGNSLGGIIDAVFDPSDTRILYVSVNGKGVYKSTDDGQSWNLRTTTFGRLFLNRKDPLILRIVNTSGVYETINGGVAWNLKSAKNDWDTGYKPTWNYETNNGILLSIDEDLSDPDSYFWVTQMWVYGTFDGGAIFGPLHTKETPILTNWWKGTGINNTEVFDLAISPADHNKMYISLWDNGLWRSIDRGESWQSCNNSSYTGTWYGKGGDSWTVIADPSRPNVVWTGIGQRDVVGYLLKSTQSGAIESWTNVGTGLPGPGKVEIWGLSVDPNSPENQRVLFVTANGAVYKSSNDGSNWSLSLNGTSISTSNADFRATAIDYFNGKIIWAGGDAGLYMSTDAGINWFKIEYSDISGIFDIKTDKSHEGWVYVACYGLGKGIYRSKDKGITWDKLWTGNYMRGIAIDPINSDILYATSSQNFCCGATTSGSTGVIRSKDGGKTWKEENNGLSWPFAFPIEIDPTDNSFVFIGTPGNGFYKRIFPDVSTQIIEINNYNKDFLFPNPISETTKIDFSSIKKTNMDKIDFYLYKLTGEEILIKKNIESTYQIFEKKGLYPGIYIFKIVLNDIQFGSGKLIVQ